MFAEAEDAGTGVTCPWCGVEVAQVASATPELAVWQHQNWVCKMRKKTYHYNRRGGESMLNNIRTWSDGSAELVDTVSLLWAAKGIRAELESKGAGVPEWLDAQIRAMNRAVEMLTADARALRAKEIRAALSGLETKAEQRARLEAELAALGQ